MLRVKIKHVEILVTSWISPSPLRSLECWVFLIEWSLSLQSRSWTNSSFSSIVCAALRFSCDNCDHLSCTSHFHVLRGSACCECYSQHHDESSVVSGIKFERWGCGASFIPMLWSEALNGPLWWIELHFSAEGFMCCLRFILFITNSVIQFLSLTFFNILSDLGNPAFQSYYMSFWCHLYRHLTASEDTALVIHFLP